MKKINRRSFLAAAGLTAAALALTACGGSASSTASSTASSAASSEAASTSAAAELTTVEAGKLTMATNAAFPPYEMTTDAGEFEGIDIDTAKAIGFGALYKGDFWDFFTGAAKIEKTLPVGVVLTISAAGSEGSDSCVITQERGNLKWGCPKTDVIRPKFAVLNPRFTCSLPAYQTASGAVDMMAHIMERYFTNTPDVGLTDRLCEALLKTVLDAAPKAIADPNDYAARADLMWAGMLAHNPSLIHI